MCWLTTLLCQLTVNVFITVILSRQDAACFFYLLFIHRNGDKSTSLWTTSCAARHWEFLLDCYLIIIVVIMINKKRKKNVFMVHVKLKKSQRATMKALNLCWNISNKTKTKKNWGWWFTSAGNIQCFNSSLPVGASAEVTLTRSIFIPQKYAQLVVKWTSKCLPGLRRFGFGFYFCRLKTSYWFFSRLLSQDSFFFFFHVWLLRCVLEASRFSPQCKRFLSVVITLWPSSFLLNFLH